MHRLRASHRVAGRVPKPASRPARSRPRRRRRRSRGSRRRTSRSSRTAPRVAGIAESTLAEKGSGLRDRQHRVEQEPLDVLRVRQGVGERRASSRTTSRRGRSCRARARREPPRGRSRGRRCCSSRAAAPRASAHGVTCAFSVADVTADCKRGTVRAARTCRCRGRRRRRACTPGRGSGTARHSTAEPRSNAPDEPWPGPPAIRNIAPRGVPSAGTSSTCSGIVPGTTPVRSRGTSTSEQSTWAPGLHGAGVVFGPARAAAARLRERATDEPCDHERPRLGARARGGDAGPSHRGRRKRCRRGRGRARAETSPAARTAAATSREDSNFPVQRVALHGDLAE